MSLKDIEDLAREAAELGIETGLPYIAASADIGSPKPMLGADGRPLAETLFRWIDPDLQYWRDSGFALRAPFVFATRFTAEPFYFQDGQLATWREAAWTRTLGAIAQAESFGVGAAIIAPAYLPRGVIGAVVWASPNAATDVRTVFEARASQFHALALKLTGTYQDLDRKSAGEQARLTRREIQCLKWAAAGKTDGEIGSIVHISMPPCGFTWSMRRESWAWQDARRRFITLRHLAISGPFRPEGPPTPQHECGTRSGKVRHQLTLAPCPIQDIRPPALKRRL